MQNSRLSTDSLTSEIASLSTRDQKRRKLENSLLLVLSSRSFATFPLDDLDLFALSLVDLPFATNPKPNNPNRFRPLPHRDLTDLDARLLSLLEYSPSRKKRRRPTSASLSDRKRRKLLPFSFKKLLPLSFLVNNDKRPSLPRSRISQTYSRRE
jgi:hypothetical protein